MIYWGANCSSRSEHELYLMTSWIGQRIVCSLESSNCGNGSWETILFVPISFEECAGFLTNFLKISGGCDVLLDFRLKILTQFTGLYCLLGSRLREVFDWQKSEMVKRCTVCKSCSWWGCSATFPILFQPSSFFDIWCWQSMSGRVLTSNNPGTIAWHLGNRNSKRLRSSKRGEMGIFLTSLNAAKTGLPRLHLPWESTKIWSSISLTFSWSQIPNFGPLWKK